MPRKHKEKHDLALEESLGEEWSRDLEIVEVPLGTKPLFYLGAAIFAIGLVLFGRIVYLNTVGGKFYAGRAEANVGRYEKIKAPRGLIYARGGEVLAKNKATFIALLDLRGLIGHQETLEETLKSINDILGISPNRVLESIKESISGDIATPLILKEGLNQGELVRLESLNLPAIVVRGEFERVYTDGAVFAPVVGYVGRAHKKDIEEDPTLDGDDVVGKSGIEAFYDKELAGKPGRIVGAENARGKILSEEKKSDPQIGASLRLTIDADLQRYFYGRLRDALYSLGRRIGVGIAMDPQTGEVLALVEAPSFDNNVLSGAGRNEEKLAILNSKDKPLFGRAVSGFYNPGSTIKPLVGVAALAEGVIDLKREIFSPGYLDVPNPYDPENPSRFHDWRYQGNVNLASALAQSSNVYFYIVGGGSPQRGEGAENDPKNYGVQGLGIGRLHEWWEKFNLGKPTGVDLPREAEGFLPTPEWKKQKTGKPWLLGDTYNVSIGQGDLLLSPIQLISYISAIANGGKLLRPILNQDLGRSQVTADLSKFSAEIENVQKGMREAVSSPLGTAKLLGDLAFASAAKTGSAQVQNKSQENAFFVGYTPADDPKIAILVLIENSREGSLNAVPVAKDVLNWYYWNRVKNK